MIKWIVLFCIVFSSPGLARQIIVRSGAHDGFSRLVFDAPSGTDWTLNQTTDGARISLIGHQDGFDISTVFDRIDRSYISSVVADDQGVSVKFACACSARVFDSGPKMIVLDVSVDTTPSEKNSEADPALSFVGRRALSFGLPRLETIQIERGMSELDTGMPFRLSSELPQQHFSHVEVRNETHPATDVNRMKAAQTKLSKRIGAAATRGILTPSHRRIDLLGISRQSQIDTRIFDAPMHDNAPTEVEIPTNGNIKITSSSDINGSDHGRGLPSNSMGVVCIDPQIVAVQNWGTAPNYSGEVAKLRAQLFDDLGRLDHDVALNLVKTYLYHGFGPEARQVLLMDKELARAHPALQGLTNIMEHGHSQNSNYMEHFVDCDSDVALWSILSVAELKPSTMINTDAALLSLNSLPMHLRTFIAPELSRRFLAYGDKNAAAAALRILERTPEPLSPNANFARANLEMAQGSVAEAQIRLSEVVSSNAEQSAEALIEYVNSHIEEDVEIDEAVATLVEAYAMEMRDSQIGDELRRTHVLALGKSGQFSAAFEALSRFRNTNSGENEDVLRSSILDLLTQNANDVEFLDHAFSQMTIVPNAISLNTGLNIAERLVRLGFYEQSEVFMASIPSQPHASKAAELRAEISLALDRPQEALAHLYGEESEAATVLRAQAETRKGDHAQAHLIYSGSGDETNILRSAWMSDEWPTLVEEDRPVLGPIVRIAQSDLINPAQLEGLLARTELSISESQDARQAIEELLNEFDLNDDTN